MEPRSDAVFEELLPFKKVVFVKDLVVGGCFDDVFFLDKIEVRQTKNDKDYWNMTLKDRTGDVQARCWSPSGEPLPVGKFVKVRADVEEYKGKKQMNVRKVRLLSNPETVDMADFVPVGPHDRFERMKVLEGIIQQIRNPGLRAVCRHVVEDTALHIAFRESPAAKSNHHCYIGGLLDHVLSLAGLVHSIMSHYSPLSDLNYTEARLDEDLLITACIWHDIGKTKELTYSPATRYTAEGSLIGHLGIGLEMLAGVRQKYFDATEYEDAATYEKAVDVWSHLRHIICSHHGQIEWRAITTPKTREAQVFHCLDLLDARGMAAFDIIDKLPVDDEGMTNWTGQMDGPAWRSK